MVIVKQPVHLRNKKHETTPLFPPKRKQNERKKQQKWYVSLYTNNEGSKVGWQSGTCLESRQKAKILFTPHTFMELRLNRGTGKFLLPLNEFHDTHQYMTQK